MVALRKACEAGARQGAEDEDDEEELESDSSDSTLDDLSSSSEAEVQQEETEDLEQEEESGDSWLDANVTHPSKEEVDNLALHVAQVAQESGDDMPEVAALRRQCVRLSKVTLLLPRRLASSCVSLESVRACPSVCVAHRTSK